MIDKQRQLDVTQLMRRVDAMLNEHILRVTTSSDLLQEQKLEIMMLVSFVASSASMMLSAARMLANSAEKDPAILKLYDDTMKALGAMVTRAEDTEVKL